MKNRIALFLVITLAMTCGFLLALLSGSQPLQAASDSSDSQLLTARLERLESALAIQQDGEATEGTTAILADERIIAALETLAENSKNLEEIVIRLEGIERELAWKRIDEQDSGAE